MTLARRLITPLVLLATLAGCGETVVIPWQPVPDARQLVKPLTGILSLPDGKGPFPAVVILHGCDGIQAQETAWASRLNGWGYAALIVDSFKPREEVGCPTLDNDSDIFATSTDRAGDAVNAALWLRTKNGIDPARIGVFGSSHGGGVAALLAQKQYQEKFPGLLKASVNYYGRCWDSKNYGRLPLLDVVGEEDGWYDFAFVKGCRAFGAGLPAGSAFEMHTYPGATHDFDDGSVGSHQFKGSIVGYDAVAAAQSFVVTKAFLDRYVGSAAN